MDRLPDAELAHVEKQKVTGYLLAFGHRLPGIEKEVREALIAEHERAVLTQDVPEKELKAGDVGTVVSVHTEQADGGDRAGYTLEFMSPSGETVAIATVFADAVRPVGPREVNHARAI